MTLAIGYDPGTRTGGLSALWWGDSGPRPSYIQSSEWSTKSDDVAEILYGIGEWLTDERKRLAKVLSQPLIFFAIEDQRWSRLPRSGVAGRTNADSSGPLMAQSVAMAWGYATVPDVLLIQPMQWRRVSVGSASKFSCPSSVPKDEAGRLRRQHAKRLEELQERVLCSMVKGCPPGLSPHEYAAIAITIAGREQIVKRAAAARLALRVRKPSKKQEEQCPTE